jgi:2-polyprenyl-6-methoxyphenol hydroxylase-like FAD-dependent oxidoreductase
VEAAFSDGTRGSYAMVIGADGIHSGIRKLVWGPESEFERFLGYYVSCGVIGNFLSTTDAFMTRQEPGKQASIYPMRGNKLATFFIFKSERQGRLTRKDQQVMLEDVFCDMGWTIQQALEAMRDTPWFYYDVVSQISLDAWHKGRVALVGDACHCLTLLGGQGASMSMAGAYILAAELERTQGNYEAAFAAYQTSMQPEIEKRQLQARKLAKTFVPESRLAITVRNLLMNALFLPGLSRVFMRRIGAESIIT